MRKFIKNGAYLLLVACMGLGFTGCSDDDPDYSDVETPTVEVTEATISGQVSAISGDAISGASVTATLGSTTLTATTGSDGSYSIEGITTAGTYTMTASADGKLDNTGSVTVALGENGIWNITLSNEGVTVTTSQTEDTSATVETETLVGNEEAQITTDVVISAAAVDDEDATITITPVYTKAAIETKASINDLMLTGLTVACSNPSATLTKPLTLSFSLDEEVTGELSAYKYVNGAWSEKTGVSVSNHIATVEADEFGSYALFMEGSVTTSSTTESISFSQSTFDNLYGSSALTVSSATYSYTQGAYILTSASNKVEAYLIEILAHNMGASTSSSTTGSYSLNVTLPIGTALTLSGHQTITQYTVSNGNYSVYGTDYGRVVITTSTYNRQHTGGSN